MNEYAQTLKEKLEQVNQYVQHAEVQSATNIFNTANAAVTQKRLSAYFTLKGFLWLLGIIVIAVSLVAFLTQATLLVIDNIFGSDTDTSLVTGGQIDAKSKKLEEIYVRADINPFDTKNILGQKPIEDLGIPGLTHIGYTDNLGEVALSNNINKYSESTLVIGGREGEIGARGNTIGGGDDLSKVTKYSFLEKRYPPVLSSKAYMVADLETGEIIIEKNVDTVYPIASVSKLMTALVARELMDMQTVAIVSRDASKTYGAQGGLGLGEKIRLRDLLFPLLMESSNDAAEVFSDQYGNAKFLEEMNKKAAAIGMVDTYYRDPSGLDPQNTSTPKDLYKLVRYIYKNDPEIFDITRVKQFSIKAHTWYNRNGLLPMAGFVGGKNGYIDQSRQTTASLFEVPLAKGGTRTVVITLLRSDTKDSDVAKLLNYLKRSAVYQAE